MGNHRRFWALAAIAGGVLAGVALPPVGWPWLLWPALALLWAQLAQQGGGGSACDDEYQDCSSRDGRSVRSLDAQ
jgi:apolipoprotein N-acyltransferase